MISPIHNYRAQANAVQLVQKDLTARSTIVN